MTSTKKENSPLGSICNSRRNFWGKAPLGELSLAFLPKSNDVAAGIDN